jgi:hypothetical protein
MNEDAAFEDVPALPIIAEPDTQGPKSMLLAVGVALAILALSWVLAAGVPEHNTGALANGVGGFWNLFLSTVTFLIWAAGIFGAIASLLLGADAWGQSRVKNARAARGETGDQAQPQGTQPSVLLAVGGGIIYYGMTKTEGVLLGVLLLVAAVVILLALVRIVLNLLAPQVQ